MTNKAGYGKHTIGELMQALKKAVEENSYLDINSPVMISDYNMSQQKYEFDVLPAFSQAHHTAGLCIFHSLGEEPYHTEVHTRPSVEEEKDTSVMKFAKWFKQ